MVYQTTRRLVVVSALVQPMRKGQQPALWAYGYADIAALVGKSTQAVRQDASRGTFDPASLASVAAYVSARAQSA